MTLDVFDFPYHTVATDNPESGYRGQFGGSYVFTSPPTDPDQRTFTLEFPLMKYFLNPDGDIDILQNPQYNMKVLSNFYQAHKMYKSFQYMHPVYGEMEVQFYKPLSEPKGIQGGDGATESFTIQLIEIP